MPRRIIGLPQRDNVPAAPVEIPKSLQKKSKPVKDMDSITAQAKAMSEKYAGQYDCVTDKDVLIDYVDTIIKERRTGLDTETTGLDIFHDSVVGFSLYAPTKKAIYVPMLHLSRFTGKVDPSQLSVEFCAQQLARLNDVKELTIDYFNAPFDMNMIWYSMGVKLWDICSNDASLMMRLLNTERHRNNNLKDLHADFCSHTTRGPRFGELFPPGTFNRCPYKYTSAYGARDAEMASELVDYGYSELRKPENAGLLRVWEDIERPLIPVLLRMREKGVLVDEAKRAELIVKYREKLEEAEKDVVHEYEPYIPKINQWRMRYGRAKGKVIDMPVKIGSEAQLKILLFDIMGLPRPESGKVDKNVLKDLGVPIAGAVLRYREAKKLLSTYLEGLDKFIQKDGCVHGGIRQIGADTGRTSACIAEGTLIECPGESKPIEQVKVGDEVYTYDDAGNLCVRKVTRVLDNGYRQCLTLKWQSSSTQECGLLTCTPDHMIKTKDAGWVMADHLKPSHKLVHFKDEETDARCMVSYNHMILSASDAGMRHVYDLEVEDTHCYIAGEICVHNCDPNLQNIPSHNREIRTMYIARPGKYLISCDYSGQEPRLTATISGDKKMIETYQKGLDLYSMIGSVAFNTTYEECLEKKPNGELYLEGKERRGGAKVIVLGVTYGRQIPSIAEQLKCTIEEAQIIYDKIMKEFSGIPEAQERMLKLAHEKGYVETLWGRRRHLSVMMHDPYEFRYKDGCNPDFDPFDLDNSSDANEVSEADKKKYIKDLQSLKYHKDKNEYIQGLIAQGIEVKDYSYQIAETSRKVFNAAVQGSAADMSKLAMITIDKDERLKKLDCHLLLMIHDEVICECPIENHKEAVTYIKEDMEKVASHLPVPFKSDPETSVCWYGSEVDIEEEEEDEEDSL